MIKIIPPQQFKGTVEIPSSKSDSQRALLAAGLANGKSILRNVGNSEDELAMLSAIQELGAKLEKTEGKTLEITGIGGKSTCSQLFSGESGLAFRLLTGISGIFEQEIEISGKGSLLERPHLFFEENCPQMGVSVESNNGKAPISVKGKYKAGEYSIDGSMSSQFISSLLFAFSWIEGKSILKVANLVSTPYLKMTIQTLQKFGAQISVLDNNCFEIEGKGWQGCDYSIEADWSSASYWLVASALEQDLWIKGLSNSSLQADKKLLNALMNANCRIIHGEKGMKVMGNLREPFHFDASDCPDLFPALVSLAAGINAISIIKGTHRLTHKESNRALTLQQEFGKIGVKIDLENDSMRVHGTGKVQEGKVSACHDHRIAMSLAITACISEGAIEIEGAEAVGKSYPRFWEDLVELSVV